MMGLILAAGQGLRLRPITDSIPKPMLPVAGKPILQYNIEALVAAGVKRMVVVVGDEPGIPHSFGDGGHLGARISYLVQPQPLGTGHAVALAEGAMGGTFLVVFGDNLTLWPLTTLLQAHRPGSSATLAVFRARDPSRHGVALLEGRRVVGVEEKPKHPSSPWALAGMYVFEPAIFQALRQVKARASGEAYLPDAIQAMLYEGRRVEACRVRGWRTNVNTPQDLLEANRAVLRARGQKVLVEAGFVHPTARLGPYVSAGQGCTFQAGCRVRESILLDGAGVGEGAKVSRAILGRGAWVPPGAVVRGGQEGVVVA